MSEVVVVRLRPLSGVRPFLYTQVRFSICVEMSDPRAARALSLPKGLLTKSCAVNDNSSR